MDRLTNGYAIVERQNRRAVLSAKTKQRAPVHYLGGCVSDISVPPTLGRTYFDAVKIYFELCAMCQAVLPASGPKIDYDYSVTGVGVDDYSAHHLLAHDESFDSAAIGDDDVEVCGYLGWLRLS